MAGLKLLAVWLGMVIGSSCFGQDPDVEGMADLNAVLQEETLTEEGAESLLLDNTRSKIGRDFYETFYKAYVNAPVSASADTSQLGQKPIDFELDVFLVTIEELPSTSGIGNVVSVSVNDLLLWQQFVQARQDIVEEYALNAVETIRQYIINYKETQQQLSSDDQKGSGIF
ncbi:CsgE family curli-type amyloid fiber assembly protein [Spirosoma soli]